MHEELLPTLTDPAAHGFTYDLRRFLRILRRGWRVLAVSVGVAVAVAAVYLHTATPLYQATAQLLIVHHPSHPLNVANPDPNRPLEGTEDYIPTHAAIVGSHVIVKRAIDSIGLGQLPTLLKGRNPVEEAIKLHLRVTRPNRMANVLQIDYTAYSSEEAIRMVEAITASYKKFLEQSYLRNGEVVALNTKAREELAHELADAEKRYVEFRQKTPFAIPDDKGRTFVTTRLEQWDRAVNEAQMREVQLRAKLELVRKLSKESAGLWVILQALNQLGGQPRDVPLAQAATGRYEQVEVRDLLKSLELSLKVSEAMRAELNKHFEESKKVETDWLTESNLRTDVERRRAMFNAVVDQLRQTQLLGGFSPVSVEALEPATALPFPVSPRFVLILGAALLLGLMVGTGIAAFRDQLDPRLLSAEDVREVKDRKGPGSGVGVLPCPETVAAATASGSANGSPAHQLKRSEHEPQTGPGSACGCPAPAGLPR